MAPRKSPSSDSVTPVGRMLRFLGLSALAGLIVAGLLLPGAAFVGAGANAGSAMLNDLPDELPDEPVAVPSKIVTADGKLIANFYEENRTPVPFDEIAQSMKDAIVSIEDERFYSHDGVDARGLARAMVNNATSDSTQGASTLTQQYVNNMLINAQVLRGDSRLTLSGKKKVSDKVKEMKLAIAVEEQMTKDEILNGYLNLVLFSGRAYGVEAAAQYVFGKSAKDLEIWESATLAGMVQSPTGYHPVRNPEGTKKRRNTVLRAMLRNDKITQEEYDHAVEQPLDVVMEAPPTGCLAADFGKYFCDYVERQVLANPAFGPDVKSRQALLDRGGLTIRTTMDSKLQEEAQKSIAGQVPNDESDGVGASLLSLEPGTGDIKVMAQNTDYSLQENEKGKTILNFNVDKEWGGGEGFQSGSTLKPFVALTWMRNGGKLIDTVDASVDTYPTGTRFAASCRDGGYVVQNGSTWDINNVIGGLKKRDRIDEGLFWSVNTPTVAAAYHLDLCDITSLMTELGLRRAVDSLPISPDNPSFVLGADSMAPMSLARAYNAIAAEGLYCEPRALLEVTDTAGNEYPVPEPDCKQVLDKDDVHQISPILQAITDKNIFSDEDRPFPAAGKTGTNNNMSSTWFVGYTDKLTTASWVGRWTNQKTLAGETINGIKRNNFYGTEISGPMWLDYMEQANEHSEYEAGKLPEWDGPRFSDYGTEGSHPHGKDFYFEDIDRPGPQPYSSED
ncbi:Multimodular transpeptidase-transglycosylase [Micrococcus lylae]|uniref:Multimodular transpeptidase-transglycosylase n=1 Tax=Micrococcus lylae TaxID=1273 RepID=A0A1R4JQN4_9MICC|nr:transglycosylase domain-containing protein [Micrococcus lylae]SJN34093.1 Multimodular transpeptidase-transglycosylase [Micrococcus lylae]